MYFCRNKQNKEKMKNLIQLFITERLDGDIEKLANFDLKQLENDEKYGCDNREFDCDDTNIARAIYALVYENVWPGLSYQSIVSKRYRGDTINTFATLFGHFDGFTIKGFDKIAKNSELRTRVVQFYSKYHTIGNMMVLPNVFVGRSSLNLYRGCHPVWHDYIDRFLVELRNNLIGEPTDEKLSTIIRANEFAFSNYQGINGFKKLIQGLYLDDYLVDGNPQIISAGYYWWKKNLDKQSYLDEVERYISVSEKVINNRSQSIIQKIKESI